MKPRNLGNNASQIKSCYWTLSGCHGRSFRICHENCLKRPLKEKSRWRHIRLANKSSLSRKPCIAYKKSIWNTKRKSWSVFQNPSWKSPEASVSGQFTMTSYPVGHKTSLSRKPCIPDKNLLLYAIRMQWALFQNLSWELPDVPHGGKVTMTSYPAYPAYHKTSLSIERNRDVMADLSETVMNISWSAPRRRNHDDVVSGWQWNLVISETVHHR